MKRSPLRRVSAKRSREMREYSALRVEFLAAHPKCQMCGTRIATDIHHKAGRTGTNYLDTATWAALCRRDHEWVHLNPRLARAQGWLA